MRESSVGLGRVRVRELSKMDKNFFSFNLLARFTNIPDTG